MIQEEVLECVGGVEVFSDAVESEAADISLA